MDNMLDLVISIINTNNKDCLKQCLESIFKQIAGINCEVFIVDNASTDGSIGMVKENFPQTKVILNNKRMGFSQNHNKVLKTTNSNFKMILNEDTVLGDGFLKEILDFARKHPKAGAIGPGIIFGDGRFQHSAFYFPSLKNELAKMFPERFSLRETRGLFTEEQCENIFNPEWLNGSCMLFNAEALSEVGYLDENFYIFYEDADICKRLSDAGWNIYYYPKIKLVHYYGKSQKSGILEEFKTAYDKSRFRYFLKHKSIVQFLILKFLILLIDFLKLLKWSLLFILFKKTVRSQEIKRKLTISLIGIRTCFLGR